MNPRYITYAITAAIILLVLIFRFRGAGKAQPVRLPVLLIRPLILVAASVAFIAFAPPRDMTTIGIMAGCLVVGSIIGWWRGRFVHIEVHPETHAITSITPIFAVLILVALVVGRLAVKFFVFPDQNQASPQAMQLNAEFVLFGLGALGVSSLEIWIRARRLLGEARAANPRPVS